MVSLFTSRLLPYIGQFMRRISKFSSIRTVILYGSVARGEADRRSDVDLAVFVSDPDPEHSRDFARILQVARELTERMQRDLGTLNRFDVVGISTQKLGQTDKSFLLNLLEEGVVLRGKLELKAGGLGLRPWELFTYDLSAVDPRRRVRICQKLFGHRSRKRVGRKSFEYRYSGLVESWGAIRVGKSVLLVDRKHERAAEHFFRLERVPYQRVRVWIPREQRISTFMKNVRTKGG